MPRVHTKIARFDTYRQGAKIPANNKKGYRINRAKPRDENDTLFCKKGETYYTWSFRYGGTHRSTTRPKPSQLTQSEFLSRIYSVSEDMPEFETKEELKEWIENTVSDLEELRDEQEEKKENMPYSLQESPTGEMLQERYDYVQEWIDELEAIDCEDEDANLDDLINEITEYQGP